MINSELIIKIIIIMKMKVVINILVIKNFLKMYFYFIKKCVIKIHL